MAIHLVYGNGISLVLKPPAREPLRLTGPQRVTTVPSERASTPARTPWGVRGSRPQLDDITDGISWYVLLELHTSIHCQEVLSTTALLSGTWMKGFVMLLMLLIKNVFTSNGMRWYFLTLEKLYLL